jgi:hypothetical protein
MPDWQLQTSVVAQRPEVWPKTVGTVLYGTVRTRTVYNKFTVKCKMYRFALRFPISSSAGRKKEKGAKARIQANLAIWENLLIFFLRGGLATANSRVLRRLQTTSKPQKSAFSFLNSTTDVALAHHKAIIAGSGTHNSRYAIAYCDFLHCFSCHSTTLSAALVENFFLFPTPDGTCGGSLSTSLSLLSSPSAEALLNRNPTVNAKVVKTR